jgi:hypothetical protein
VKSGSKICAQAAFAGAAKLCLADRDPEFLKTVITGDKSWLYRYDPFKPRSSHHSGSICGHLHGNSPHATQVTPNNRYRGDDHRTYPGYQLSRKQFTALPGNTNNTGWTLTSTKRTRNILV